MILSLGRFRSWYRVVYRVLANGGFCLTTKPAKLRSFYPGADMQTTGQLKISAQLVNLTTTEGDIALESKKSVTIKSNNIQIDKKAT